MQKNTVTRPRARGLMVERTVDGIIDNSENTSEYRAAGPPEVIY
jgi:hypothetical protein